ncbi:hypothetical protein ACQY1Q_10770 [Tenacibaculum sp. TC6]|uniref:hypothetical protein n=1 Tax=Tenacibaculum sp. TC6 TaxID=3423223 RepID=UPI003D36F045
MKQLFTFISLLFVVIALQAQTDFQYADEFMHEGDNTDIITALPRGCGCEEPNLSFSSGSSFATAVANENLIKRAAERGLDEWYKNQKNVIENFLESKYNKQFSSFEEAKNHLFLDLESTNSATYVRPIARSKTADRDRRAKQRVIQIKGLKALKIRESEIRGGNINNSLYADFKVNNIALKDYKTLTDIQTAYSNLLTQFIDNKWKEFESDYIAKILSTPFNNHTLQTKNNDYTSFNTWEKLDYMQFLIHYEELVNRPSPYGMTDEERRLFERYINKLNTITSKYVEDYINANKYNELSLFHPDYWKVIWKNEYHYFPYKIDEAKRKHQELKDKELRILINSISMNATSTIDYLVSLLKITDKDQLQWFNDHPNKGEEFYKRIQDAKVKDANMPPPSPKEMSFPPDFNEQEALRSIRAELANGAIVGGFIRELAITDVSQKRFLYDNTNITNELRTFANENRVNGVISAEAKAFIKQAIALEKTLNNSLQVKQTGSFPEEISSCCPGSCCPNQLIYQDDLIMHEYGVQPVQAAVDGTFNLIVSTSSLIASDRWVGERVRRIMTEIGMEVPSDISDEHLGALFKIRKRNGLVIVEYKEGLLREMLDFGLNTLDMLSFLSPSKGGGAFLAAKMGGRITITKMTEHLRSISVNSTKVDNLVNSLKNKAKFDLNGTGQYSVVKGHHPLAKSAFKSDKFYDIQKAFSVSTESLGGQSVHYAITGNQNRLYSAFAKTGEVLTIDKMANIEIKAMVDAGIPENIATGWVIKALEDLKAQGVKVISHVPWNGIN